jgi:phage terminase small subunit
MPAGRPKGYAKTGGKKKGTPNHATAALLRKQRKVIRFEANVERVLNEYSLIAGLDIREAFSPDGCLKPIDQWPESIARSVAGIEVVEMGDLGYRLHKIKLHSKLHALDSIAKHLGMFVDKFRLVDKEGNDRSAIDPLEAITSELARIAERERAGIDP